jgi:hypothetical protein
MPTKSATWSELKSVLRDYEKPELLRLLQELYKLNADNKLFLTARLVEMDLAELAEPYRNAIRAEFNPSRGFPRLNLRAARKVLNDFKKACKDPAAVADLMIYYVEQGVICTNNYGDIDERFYNSLASVYADAAKLLTNTADADLIERFAPRMGQIVQETSGIGWGFHDELSHLYYNEYPAEAE